VLIGFHGVWVGGIGLIARVVMTGANGMMCRNAPDDKPGVD
jgi:hypothetical protein